MKKLLILLIAVLFLFLLISSSKYILLANTLKMSEGEKGEISIVYLVSKDNKYGYISREGELLYKYDLLNAREFSDGLAAVKINNILKQECFINSAGKVMFNRDMDRTGDFYEGMALIWNIKRSNSDLYRTDQINKDLKFGYINKSGKVIVKPVFREAKEFSDGLAAVKNDQNKWGFINKDGKYSIEPKFDYVYSFNDGYAPVLIDAANNEYSYIDKKGTIVISPDFTSPSVPSEGLIIGSTASSPDTLVCIDYKGAVVFSIKGDNAGYFKDGLAPVAINNKWGYINKEGRIVINNAFDNVSNFSDGLAAVQVGEKWGFIDKNGKVVINPAYDAVTDFKDGVARVSYIQNSIETKYAYINKDGDFLWKSW
jgi:hypothetical protein